MSKHKDKFKSGGYGKKYSKNYKKIDWTKKAKKQIFEDYKKEKGEKDDS